MHGNSLRWSLLGGVALLIGSCGGTVCPPGPTPLTRGGVHVSYVNPDSCVSCEALDRRDIIGSLDGRAVSTADDLAPLMDGQPHVLEFWDASEALSTTTTTTITAKQGDPLALFSVGVTELDRAPAWARRRLFGHASPKLLLVEVGGGSLDGRELYGRKRLLVLFDWATSSDQQDAALCMQVLQKAQADLRDQGVDIVFAQVPHPQPKDRVPMKDSDLRAFFDANQVRANEGGPLPPPPLYRSANKTEDHRSRVLGLEHETSYVERIGEAPNIVILDEHGVIRWHSAGATPDPSGEIPVDMVYTINEAVWFALREL